MICPLLGLVLLWACATSGPTPEKSVTENHLPTHDIFWENHDDEPTEQHPSAEDLLREALTKLNLPEDGQRITNTRNVLHRLIEWHPDSPWRVSAEALLQLIDHQEACSEQSKADQALYERTLAQKLKCEESETLCRLELMRLREENDLLKKDLLNLKNLEIELEKRTRSLR